jgi:hypothetical protein
MLSTFSIANSLYALYRTKPYRFFESNGQLLKTNSNARRVQVENSPISSPLRYIKGIVMSAPIQSSDNDEENEVWEMSVWDPLPVSLRLFVLFSPAHVLVTSMFLPSHASNSNPSISIATTVLVSFLLSIQGHLLSKQYSQQSKDTMTIYREVSKEYDTKFVRPAAQKHAVRDVGTQFPHSGPVWNERRREWTAVPDVVSSTPYSSPRGFQTRPNPAYASHYDPSAAGSLQDEDSLRSQRLVTPSLKPSISHRSSTGTATTQGYAADLSSPVNVMPASSKRPSNASIGTGDGGSLGVFSHAASPLRKTASANLLRQTTTSGIDGQRRESSPLKRTSITSDTLHQRLTHARDRQSRY